MDATDMMAQVRSMDADALTKFVSSVRGSPALQMGIRTVAKSRGLGQVFELFVDKDIPVSEVVSFLQIVTKDNAQEVLPIWLDAHPALQAKIEAIRKQ